MRASPLPCSLSLSSRNSTIAIDAIGTMTMATKNSVRRLRKLMCPAGGYPRLGRPQTAWTHFGGYTAITCGAIAQLGERLDRTQEVGGSSPPSSTPRTPAPAGVLAFGRHYAAAAAASLSAVSSAVTAGGSG